MLHFSSRIVLLTFLYFVQGLPYGLQARFLPVFLRTKGLSLSSLGFFKMLLVPWLCKALWAPLVDKYANKQKWLLWSIFGLMLTCAITSLIPPDNMFLLCICIFSLNLFAATQDIAVDGIAVTILPPEELGQGNTAQVVGYKIGAIFGGGILVWFMDALGWTGLFLVLTLLYIEALLFVYLSPTLRIISRLGVPKVTIKQHETPSATKSDPVENDTNNSSNLKEKHSTGQKETKKVPMSSEHNVKPCNSVTKVKDEDLSKLIKSAMEFIEAKDPLEQELELRHKLKGDTVGRQKQDETVKDIVDTFNNTSDHGVPDDKGDRKHENVKTDKSHADTSKTLVKCEQTSNAEEIHTLQHCKDTNLTSSTDDVNVSVSHCLDINTETKSDVKIRTEVKHSGKMKLNDKIELAKDIECIKDLKPSAEDIPPINTEELGYLDESDVEGSELNEGEERTHFVQRDEQSEDEKELGDSDDTDDTSHDSFTCSVHFSSRFSFIWDVLKVPNTQWIVIYVLIYKLGEQGALGMLPLFLIDKDVAAVDVTFWTGVIGQATSIFGSCLGGWILSHPVYRLPCRLLIYQLSLCRMLPLGLLLWVVMLWSGGIISPLLLYRGAIASMNLLLIISGMITTCTFTLMMECTQQAPPSVQATHYTLLSSMEVFGKLGFMSVCGALVDMFGYTTMYLTFVVLSAALIPWLWRYPDILCEKKHV